MAEIRPEEVSAILREQLSQSRTDVELEEVGTVLSVGCNLKIFFLRW